MKIKISGFKYPLPVGACIQWAKRPYGRITGLAYTQIGTITKSKLIRGGSKRKDGSIQQWVGYVSYGEIKDGLLGVGKKLRADVARLKREDGTVEFCVWIYGNEFSDEEIERRGNIWAVGY